MSDQKQLYIMISRTQTGMGKLIRLFTGYRYNHVSLSLDPTFRSWVSFARYHCDAPLYGGYIVEPAERLLSGGSSMVRIFSIDITGERQCELEKLFSEAGVLPPVRMYNTFDALAAPFGKHIPISDSFTCLSFACAVLGQQFASIRKLDEYLTPFLIYEGRLDELVPDSGNREDVYFKRLGMTGAFCETFRHFSRLISRAAHSRHSC